MKNNPFCLYVYTASTMSEKNTAEPNTAEPNTAEPNTAAPSAHAHTAHRQSTTPPTAEDLFPGHVELMREGYGITNYQIPKEVDAFLQELYE